MSEHVVEIAVIVIGLVIGFWWLSGISMRTRDRDPNLFQTDPLPSAELPCQSRYLREADDAPRTWLVPSFGLPQ